MSFQPKVDIPRSFGYPTHRFTFTDNVIDTVDAPQYLTLIQAISTITGKNIYIFSIYHQLQKTVANLNHVLLMVLPPIIH